MAKLIKLSIDLTKIEKAAIIEGKNGGKYINVDVWVNNDKAPDQFGNNCGVKQSIKRPDGTYEGNFIGSGKTSFGFENKTPVDQNYHQESNDPPLPPKDESDLPF